ncbi:MAG: VirB3 family type IV secretion system protein [Psittacicella sp.]
MKKYTSFNGFSRPALIAGVPLFYFIILVLNLLIFGFICLELKSFIFFGCIALIEVILYFYLKFITEKNINSVNFLKITLKEIFIRIIHQNIKILTVGITKNSKIQEKKDVQEFFWKN